MNTRPAEPEVADTPPAPDAAAAEAAKAAWVTERATYAGGVPERAQALEAFETADDFWAKALAKPAEPNPDQWRVDMVGDDPDGLKFVSRYTDQKAAFKAWKAATEKISADGRVKIPGEGATPEEIAEYTKAIGVPEKPDAYKITATPVEGYEVSDNDKSALTTITTKVHEVLAKGGGPNDIVNLAHQLYLDMAADNVINAENRAADFAVEGEAVNRQLWGPNYDKNIAWAIAGAKQFFPGKDEEFNAWSGQRLASGGALFDDPVIQQMFANIGLANAEDPFMLAAAKMNAGFDPQKRKDEILAMRNGSSAQQAEYKKLSAPGGELEKLNEGLEKRKAKAA